MSRVKDVFEKLRDLFEVNQGHIIGNDVYPDYEELRKALYNGMKDTNTLDTDYINHVPQCNGLGYRMLTMLGVKYGKEDYTSLQSCYTALTFVLLVRELGCIDDSFDMFTDEGDIYKALVRICDLLE